jgi:LPS export ABC transporter protein LptC
MHRLAQRILAVVAVFVLIVTGMLIARSRTARTESSGPQPSAADLAIKDVQLQEESSRGSRWQLRADQASVFEQEGRTALRKVTVLVHDRDTVWTIVGDEGDFFKESRNLEVRRNVVLTSQDGLRLETTVLRWTDNKRLLWTDVPVRITRAGAVIDGSALDVHIDQEATTVKGRVRATFTEGQGK